ncbi:MAG: hypothetical protein QME96_13695 [Myxococcota bacterium]|nr:hypothetical protein [Myxococcota bacterium]
MMRAVFAAVRRLPVLVVLGCLPACSCPTGMAADGGDTACTFASCDRECREAGLCYGSCAAGRCNCTDACGGDGGPDVPADSDAPDADRGADDAAREDAREDGDPWEASEECLLRSPGETRAGASPGVVCRQISLPEMEDTLLAYSADGDRIALAAYVGGRPPPALWEYRRSTGCFRILDAGLDTPDLRIFVAYSAVEGSRIAYVVVWAVSSTQLHCQLRLLDAESGERRTLDSNTSTLRPGGACIMNSVRLEYPWVAWRDVRESDLYRWNPMALNVETAERRNLGSDPPDGLQGWDTNAVDLLGGVMLWGLVGWDGHQKVVAADLPSGRRWPVTEAPGMRWSATVTPGWFAWLDQRNHDGCSYMSPCSTDIYGWNRVTGQEQALVIAGDTMQGPGLDGEGPWLVYGDQRGGADITIDADREQDLFALHLPTMTEIRVTDWPGGEWEPKVYRRVDGSFGVLLAFELSYRDSLYRLWDCDLPEPAGG